MVNDFAWLRPDIGRIIINPKTGIQIAGLPLDLPKHGEIMCPAILLNVTGAHRKVALPFVTMSQNAKVQPIVHIWERTEKWTAIGVLFVIPNPSKDALVRALPGNESAMRENTWKEVRLFFDAKVPTPAFAQLSDMYKSAHALTVMLTTNEAESEGMQPLAALNPIARWVARDLAFSKPVVILNLDER